MPIHFNTHVRDDEAFWLVWNPDRGMPTRGHASKECAEAEANRLALSNKGQRFYVLKAESFWQTEAARRVVLEEPAPF